MGCKEADGRSVLVVGEGFAENNAASHFRVQERPEGSLLSARFDTRPRETAFEGSKSEKSLVFMGASRPDSRVRPQDGQPG